MARVARSPEPLYQTRDRPVAFPIAMTNPDGSALDLTGASAVALLKWSATTRPLVVSALDATGRFVVSGAASLTADLPLGRVSELVVSVTDSLGAVTDFVWPIVGETP